MNLSPQQLAAALGGEAKGNKVSAPGPGHSPGDRSVSVLVDPNAPDGFVVYSHAGEDALSIKDYIRERAGLNRWEPARRQKVDNIARMADRVRKPVAKADSAPATYIYNQPDGTPYLRVVRPGFYQSHWNGSSWVNGAPAGPKIPYRLPELLAAEHDEVLIVEGEKDADNVAKLGFTVTTNPGGAGKNKFPPELAQYFKGRNVSILPDNDEPGEEHAQQIVAALRGIANSIRIVKLPGLPDKGDVSDWIDSGGTANELGRLIDASPVLDPSAPPLGRITLIPFDDIKLSRNRRDLVKGLLPRVGLALVWGKPKCGKSFWLFDLMMHVALGWEYRGRRTQQGAVVYCSFEGQTGLEARVEAFRAKRLQGHIGPVPFFLMPVTLDLIKDHQALIKAIRDKLGDQCPVAVNLDTLNRSLAGSENSDEDMAAYIRASDAIRESFHCVVPIVHHCGHEGSRPRGHSSIGGAIDAQIKVERNGSNQIITEVELAKDGPEGALTLSTLETVTVGVDEDGEEITSCVICEADEEPGQRQGRSWPKGLKTLHEVITEAILAKGVDHVIAGDGPSVKAVDVMEARSIHTRRYIPTGAGDPDAAERKAWQRNFKRALDDGLTSAEKVGNQHLVWIV